MCHIPPNHIRVLPQYSSYLFRKWNKTVAEPSNFPQLLEQHISLILWLTERPPDGVFTTLRQYLCYRSFPTTKQWAKAGSKRKKLSLHWPALACTRHCHQPRPTPMGWTGTLWTVSQTLSNNICAGLPSHNPCKFGWKPLMRSGGCHGSRLTSIILESRI